METTVQVNDCKFHKPGKWKNSKNGELIHIKFKENISAEIPSIVLLLRLNW